MYTGQARQCLAVVTGALEDTQEYLADARAGLPSSAGTPMGYDRLAELDHRLSLAEATTKAALAALAQVRTEVQRAIEECRA